VLNVALGGTLIQDLPSERPSAIAHDPDQPRTSRTHRIDITPDTRVSDALGATSLDVNSVHHQAIGRLAGSLVVTAKAPDGVIEAVETARRDPWWVLGVQWHPEEFADEATAPDHGLIAAFANMLGATSPAAK
jgi:putative glutamine amidotransferase